ncbi:WD40 repeat-like protein [Auriscalpium vulgare]|uniref:WD40 repeat-like protein n=1 Tax=Auriscalpium vulgare TaxID=40419 RepID=A0ACB8R9S5_9AGAM|nr:WD40 repeat-like protein [Auriscalpium vulgare]
MQTGLIQNAHNDLVTDAAYDFYGLRLATCSLDQRIKVWQLDEHEGTWNATGDWKAHDAAVSKIAWAHPEFGSVIASSSFDRTVKIWEETPADADQPQVNGATASASSSRWVERAVTADAKGSVRGVEFAPHRFGLKLATISSDNSLRTYECLEAPSLTTWQLVEEVDVLALPSASSTSHSHTHTLAVATPTQTAAAVDGAPAATLVANALQQHQNTPQNRPVTGNREADGGWAISWCKDRYWGEVIAAAAGVNGVVKIIQLSPSRRPTTLLSLDPSPAVDPTASVNSSHFGENDTLASYAITSVAWAPSCGRSYHLIATGGRDGHVRIWRVKPTPYDDDRVDSLEEVRWTGNIVADFDHHKSAVGRVEWNVTGTVLSSAGNDGRIRLWKATSGNIWRPAGHISVEQAEEQQKEGDVEMDDGAD